MHHLVAALRIIVTIVLPPIIVLAAILLLDRAIPNDAGKWPFCLLFLGIAVAVIAWLLRKRRPPDPKVTR